MRIGLGRPHTWLLHLAQVRVRVRVCVCTHAETRPGALGRAVNTSAQLAQDAITALNYRLQPVIQQLTSSAQQPRTAARTARLANLATRTSSGSNTTTTTDNTTDTPTDIPSTNDTLRPVPLLILINTSLSNALDSVMSDWESLVQRRLGAMLGQTDNNNTSALGTQGGVGTGENNGTGVAWRAAVDAMQSGDGGGGASNGGGSGWMDEGSGGVHGPLLSAWRGLAGNTLQRVRQGMEPLMQVRRHRCKCTMQHMQHKQHMHAWRHDHLCIYEA